MSTEITVLLLTSILAASLLIPFIVGVNSSPQSAGAADPFVVPSDPLRMKPWIARSYRAHQNLLEQFLPFAIIVLIAHVLGVSTLVTKWACIAFLGLRLVHAAGMITAVTRMPLRPAIFSAGYVCILAIAWEIFAHA